MKRNNKIGKLLCLLSICVFLQGCQSPLVVYRHPAPQSNSVWSTDDDTVVFYVGEDEIDPIYGSIETDDGTVEISIAMGTTTSLVDFYYGEDRRNWDHITPLERFAYGYGKIISRKEYQIEITDADAFFESGQVLTFYRVQDGTD